MHNTENSMRDGESRAKTKQRMSVGKEDRCGGFKVRRRGGKEEEIRRGEEEKGKGQEMGFKHHTFLHLYT